MLYFCRLTFYRQKFFVSFLAVTNFAVGIESFAKGFFVVRLFIVGILVVKFLLCSFSLSVVLLRGFLHTLEHFFKIILAT